MALNLRHLRVFATVAQYGGFSRAAAALRLSQPAVSKAVGALEAEVGLPLLERGPPAVRLTEAGAALLERAHEIFGAERIAEEELRAFRGVQRGRLRIGASTTIATYLLPSLLGEFRARHAGIELRVVSANTRDVARLMLARRIDVALVEGPVHHPRLSTQPWRDDELVVIAPPDHPLARRRRVTAAALAAEAFIARERGSGTRAVIEAALAARGLTLRTALQLGSTEAIKQAVAAGLGLAIVSRATAADQLALGRIAIVAVADLPIRRSFTRLHLAGSRPTAAAASFGTYLEGPA